MVGDPHTDPLAVTERLSRPDHYTLHYEATINDPGAYTARRTIAMANVRYPDGALIEYICQENNLWEGSVLNR